MTQQPKAKATFVPLNRRFIPWGDEKASIETASIYERTAYGRMDWSELLEHQRVVILAEAGSGKSEELEHQAAILEADDKRVFHTTVQDLARDGLAGALTNQKRAELEAWKTSNDRAYFLVDSIDEAKLDSIRIETAFKKLADGLDGAMTRATIILSGRYTDWEFESDLRRLDAMLPIRGASDGEEIPVAELLSKILNNEWNEQKQAVTQKPLVVLMASLDEAQVREFAHAKGIPDVDAFIEGINNENLWELAHRPLDLGWLVEYWNKHRRFGTLATMLAASIDERLKETNRRLALKDSLSEARSLEAMERVGAAMVFGRADKVLIPDQEAEATDGDFRLEKILPDWSEEHRGRLRARPIFDAATFGRIRLHNDNEGTVRSYLAARWLKRRRDKGCSVNAVYDLLFAETYGLSLVKPSAAQTAAWLSIWDSDVARKLIATDPALLLKGGDPGSLSLRVRAETLEALAERIAEEDDWFGWLDWPNLRRFSSPDLAPILKALWTKHSHKDVRHLLLQLMVAGNLADCIDIASGICLGGEEDRISRVLASRLLVKFGSADALAHYAELLRASPQTMPAEELDEAILALFPRYISVSQFLAILAAVPILKDTGTRLVPMGPQLADKLSDPAELEELLVGLLAHLTPSNDDDADEETPSEKSYFPTMQGAVARLLALTPPDEVPEVAIDTTIRLGARRFYTGRSDLSALYAALHATPARRRTGMWRAHQTVDASRFNQPITSPYQLDALGWPAGLRHEDLAWLLEDASQRTDKTEQEFALVCALGLWRDNEKSEADLARIEAVARPDPKLAAILDGWLAPPVVQDWEKKHNRDMKRIQARNAAERVKRDNSWLKFVEELQAEPDALRNLAPRNDNSVDGRLFSFWELLNAVTRKDARYQIDDVSPLEPLFGRPVVEAARDGLIGYWRGHKPTVDSEKEPEKRNSISKLDCMGIVGISLEAVGNPGWAASLNSTDAERAAAYATIELNGFPSWFGALAEAKPAEVSRVLMREIVGQLTPNSGLDHGILQDIAYTSVEIARLVYPALLADLTQRPALTGKLLNTTVSILVKGVSSQESRHALLPLALERFQQTQDADDAASYLYAAFSVDPQAATTALTDRLASMDSVTQTAFCKKALPRIFGDRISGGGIDPRVIPFPVLESLVGIAYRTIRPEEDHNHKSGEVYSFDDRDHAEGARSVLYNRLADTPGPATVEALRRVGPIMGMPSKRTEEIIARRAAQDSEAGPWPAPQAYEMELEFDVAPQNPADLQKIALRRFSDINHDAHVDDFAQGRTLKSLPTEADVQMWVGNELKARRGRGYSTERESEVVGNNRPDIRLRSGDVSLPVEVKIPESWSLADLEKALIEQLDGRYLLHQDARHGVLLLVHLTARPQGWQTADGRWLSFAEVVAHLQAIAASRAGASHDAAKAVVAVIDVSDIAPVVKKRKSRKRK